MSLASSADLWLTVQAAVSAKDGNTHTSGSVLELDIYFEDFADSLDLLEFTVAYYHSLAYTKSWEVASGGSWGVYEDIKTLHSEPIPSQRPCCCPPGTARLSMDSVRHGWLRGAEDLSPPVK